MQDANRWDIDHVEALFYRYVNENMENEVLALRNSPKTSEERRAYDALFGAAEPGKLASLLSGTRAEIEQLVTLDLTAGQKERKAMAKIATLVGLLDYHGDEIKVRGARKIREKQRPR